MADRKKMKEIASKGLNKDLRAEYINEVGHPYHLPLSSSTYTLWLEQKLAEKRMDFVVIDGKKVTIEDGTFEDYKKLAKLK